MRPHGARRGCAGRGRRRSRWRRRDVPTRGEARRAPRCRRRSVLACRVRLRGCKPPKNIESSFAQTRLRCGASENTRMRGLRCFWNQGGMLYLLDCLSTLSSLMAFIASRRQEARGEPLCADARHTVVSDDRRAGNAVFLSAGMGSAPVLNIANTGCIIMKNQK